jgi:mono/diheme cytochrome c family protein
MLRVAPWIAILPLMTLACDSGQDDPAPAPAKAESNTPADADAAKGEAAAEGGEKAAADIGTPDSAATKATPAMIERGKYLAEAVMNCRACHTPNGENGPDLGRAYAGGLEFDAPFGTWRAPNITQDEKTGIGGWTDQQIADAVRAGKRPTGEQMYPVMPYRYFGAISDEDMEALLAYLRTVPAVENAVAGNTDLKLERPAHEPAKHDPPIPGDLVNEGAYLVKLAHCGDCHTPIGEDGMPDVSRAYAGGREFHALDFQGTGTVYAANITPHEATGIGKYSDEELMTAITELDKRDGSAILGPMTFYVGAWSKLTHKDAKAIAAFLRSLPAVENEVPKSTWKPPTP